MKTTTSRITELFLQMNPFADEAAKLFRILNLRLRWVRADFADDVRSRKAAIIDGRGSVHGDARDLEGEYCFNRQLFYAN